MSKIREILENNIEKKYTDIGIPKQNFNKLEKELQEYVHNEINRLEDIIDRLEKERWLGGDDVRLKSRWG